MMMLTTGAKSTTAVYVEIAMGLLQVPSASGRECICTVLAAGNRQKPRLTRGLDKYSFTSISRSLQSVLQSPNPRISVHFTNYHLRNRLRNKMSVASQRGGSSYFDLPQSPNPPSAASTPISPGTSPPLHRRVGSRSLIRNLGRRTRSDYSAVHQRVHVQALEEDLPDHLPAIHTSTASNSSLNADRVSKYPHVPKGNRYQQSLPSVRCTARDYDDKQVLPLSKDNHAYPPRSPRLGHTWARTQSGGVWFERRKAPAERRPSSDDSEVPSEQLPVRTQQTPLKPPSAGQNPKPSASSRPIQVKVETSFAESDLRTSETVEQTSSRSISGRKESGSRRSSSIPKLLSNPLTFIRRLSLPKRAPKVTFSPASAQSPISTVIPRMADHPSLLKRNYTDDALQRATAILQESKASNPGSLWPPTIKPLRSRTKTEKTTADRGSKGIQTVQGITTRFTMAYGKSVEVLSDVSYPSSVSYTRPANQPTNTPEEQATYKVKRSPSAETEEFLKVDISIRGGTSYLPSEARRIHTPPLPEETQDGKLKGFFFDYNAPRSEGSRRRTRLFSYSRRGGSVSTVSPEGETASRLPAMGQNLSRTRSKKCKIPHTGDWYDVKLAELDVTDGGSPYPDSDDSRVYSPNSFCQLQKHKEEEQLDYNIPEHLPSSPLCPRNPRYWRVVKGKGSQFRGCWMHGVGEYEVTPGLRMN